MQNAALELRALMDRRKEQAGITIARLGELERRNRSRLEEVFFAADGQGTPRHTRG